jgi:hypothetical protein
LIATLGANPALLTGLFVNQAVPSPDAAYFLSQDFLVDKNQGIVTADEPSALLDWLYVLCALVLIVLYL